MKQIIPLKKSLSVRTQKLWTNTVEVEFANFVVLIAGKYVGQVVDLPPPPKKKKI